MIQTVVREHHWSPQQVSELYYDAQDYMGLGYWYKDVILCSEKAEEKIEELKNGNK